jgi:uncharacterized protein
MQKSHTLSPYASMDDGELNLAAARNRSPLAYFMLTFALSIPFWVLGAVSQRQLLPSIPVSALMIVAPMIAALIFVYRENKAAGVQALLKSAFDFKRVKFKLWYVPTILLMPGIMLISYVALRMAGVALPNPQFSLLTTLVLFAVFFIAALCEELGWMGYAIDPLQDPLWRTRRCLAAGCGVGRVAFYPIVGSALPGGRSARWHIGSSSLGSTTTRVGASSWQPSSTR